MKRIKQLRNMLGLSQEEFGARLGVTAPGISKIEQGHRNLTDQMAIAICREYNVREEWLRDGAGKPFYERHKEDVAAAYNAKMHSDNAPALMEFTTVKLAMQPVPLKMFAEMRHKSYQWMRANVEAGIYPGQKIGGLWIIEPKDIYEKFGIVVTDAMIDDYHARHKEELAKRRGR